MDCLILVTMPVVYRVKLYFTKNVLIKKKITQAAGNQKSRSTENRLGPL